MPRPAKPPRLYLRARNGRDPVFVIRHSDGEVSTGYGPDRPADAEKAFSDWLAARHQPRWGDGDPARIPVADVLTLYMTEVAVGHEHPEMVDYHAGPLLDFFGMLTCWDVTTSACKAYVAARCLDRQNPAAQDLALLNRYLSERGDFARPANAEAILTAVSLALRRAVKTGTARRELETLNAAMNYAYRSRKLSKPIIIDLPPKAPPRTRWLTRSEAARLLAGAMGFEILETDDKGRPLKWRRAGPASWNVARFVLSTLYNCTRHEASLTMLWHLNTGAGWYDLERRVMYRRGAGTGDTKKRRTPAPIPDRLYPHLARWRGLTTLGPCEFRHPHKEGAEPFEARITQRMKTGWKRAVRYAGLGNDVTPHVLKHTSITWLLQNGVSTWEVAGFSGTSEKIIRDVYGHHAPDHLPAARRGFQGRNWGERR